MNPARLPVPLIALALLAGCSGRPGPEDAGSPAPVRVAVAAVAAEDAPALSEVTATVRPLRHALLAAKVMGAIEAMPVVLGQRVRAGDVLVRISAGEISARLRQAEAQLSQAQRDLERERALLVKGASTPDMVNGLTDRFAMTQAMVGEAETMLGYTTLRAPFDGVIARKQAETGDLASPGQPLLEIEGTDAFQIEAGIPDSLAAGLAVGAPLPVEVPAAGARFGGTLVELSPSADPFAHTVPAKIAVPAGAAVRSGQFARVGVPGAPTHTLTVPASAVTVLGQMERVFVVADGRAVLRLVRTGAGKVGPGGPRVEILAGLAAGETVVAAPPAGLREGQPLEVGIRP